MKYPFKFVFPKRIPAFLLYVHKKNKNCPNYSNGEIIGDYTQGPIKSWTAGDVEALFGPRALIAGTAHGWVVARVEDARIYNAVLTENDINNLEADTLDVEPQGKLAAIWGKLKK